MNNKLIIVETRLNLTNLRVEMYPAEGSMLKSIDGSIPTHGELLKVSDHSSCRKMYIVPPLECPLESRRHFRKT